MTDDAGFGTTAYNPHLAVTGYAIGALDLDEAAAFENHLLSCPECQAELADLRELTASLSGAVSTEPPARLRTSVLDAVAQLADSRGVEPRRDDTTADPGLTPAARNHVAVGADRAPAPVTELRRRSRSNRAVGLLAAAAVVAALATGAWGLENRNDAQEAQSQSEMLLKVFSSPDIVTRSNAFTTGGSATLAVSKSAREALLIGSGLPALTGGHVYEAWTITKNTPQPAGTFTTTGQRTLVSLPAAALSAKTIAVTVEPKGGSSKPTTAPVFSVNLGG